MLVVLGDNSSVVPPVVRVFPAVPSFSDQALEEKETKYKLMAEYNVDGGVMCRACNERNEVFFFFF